MKRIRRSAAALWTILNIFLVFPAVQAAPPQNSSNESRKIARPQLLDNLSFGAAIPSTVFAVPSMPVYLQQAPAVGDAVPQQTVEPQASPLGLSQKDMETIWEMADAIAKYYVYPEKLKNRHLYYAALKGMFRSLDPYSDFYTPEEFKKL